MPKIIFKKMSKEQNVDLVKWSFFVNDETLDVYKYTIEYFPELKDVDKTKSQEEIYKIIEDVVGKYYDYYENEIINEIERYNKIWSKYNDNYIEVLCNYLNIKWPSNKEIINAYVGITPVCPKDIDTFNFYTTINIDSAKIIQIVAHEVLHFAWFLKWRKLYPSCPRLEYDPPYLPWKYSEMVTDFILNSKYIQDVFNNNFKERSYESFYDINYDGKNVMEELKNIYNMDINIEDKIKLGYDYLTNIQDK